MSWFGNVPESVKVIGTPFLPASEALARVHGELYDDRDYGAEAILLIARLQLDQMTEILTDLLGDDAVSKPGVEIEKELDSHLTMRGVDDLAYEVSSVSEGLYLRQALSGCMAVAHGCAADGSISITTGPPIPELFALELRGSEDTGELNDEPDVILERARWCTEAAAKLYHALQTDEGKPALRS